MYKYNKTMKNIVLDDCITTKEKLFYVLVTVLHEHYLGKILKVIDIGTHLQLEDCNSNPYGGK